MGMDVYSSVYWGIVLDTYDVSRLTGTDDEGDSPEEVQLNSTTLGRAVYLAGGEQLFLQSKSGDWVSYSGVPRKVFAGLAKAKSPDGYFAKSVQGKFNAEPSSAQSAEAAIMPVEVPPLYESIEDISQEGVEVTAYQEGSLFSSDEPDGYLIGFEVCHFSGGSGPSEFDPAELNVDEERANKLKAFCQKCDVTFEPKLWVYVYISN